MTLKNRRSKGNFESAFDIFLLTTKRASLILVLRQIGEKIRNFAEKAGKTHSSKQQHTYKKSLQHMQATLKII